MQKYVSEGQIVCLKTSKLTKYEDANMSNLLCRNRKQYKMDLVSKVISQEIEQGYLDKSFTTSLAEFFVKVYYFALN